MGELKNGRKANTLDEIIGDSKIEFELVNSLPRRGKAGTIYICDKTEYLFVKKAWREIGKVENYYTGAELVVDGILGTASVTALQKTLAIQTQEEKPPTNCKNCGAVLRGHVCEYCGTRY